MERVDGFGGFFFRAKDPKGIAQWYAEHLGVTVTPTDYGGTPWTQTAGPTVFQPFPESTKYFGDPGKQFMLNFRVTNLLAMVHQLQASGVSVDLDPKEYPNGWFAHLTDPEGNKIELWQPKAPEAKK